MSTQSSFRRTVGLTLGVVWLSACHTYRPVDTPAIGSMVRVQVPVTSALDGPNEAPRTVAIEGVTVSVGDTLVLATTTRREYGAFREITQSDTVRLSTAQTSSIDVREFSSGRSVFLGVVLAAGATFAAVVAFNAGGDGSGGEIPGTGDPPTMAIVASSSLLSAVWGLITR